MPWRYTRLRGALRLIRILDRDEVNFMPEMKIPQHFQSADLTAFGRRMHEVRVDPQNLHALSAIRSSLLT